MGRRPEFAQYRAFRARVNELRTTYGARWVVCTGRSMRGYARLFRTMITFGIKPDFVITRHAYIYECRPWGYLPHWIWNLRVLWLQWKDAVALRRAMPKLRRAVVLRNPFARVLFSGRERLRFRFEDEGAGNFAAEILELEVKPYKYLQVFHAPGELEVRMIPFTKGLAVQELARRLGVANREILVVGDGHNDISMIEMQPPCLTACPGNAAADVIEAVHRTGGHIANDRSLGGVLEVLSAYESGAVRSTLPEGWTGHDAMPATPRRRSGIRGTGTWIVLLVVLYTTLLVVCTFCRFPGRDKVLKPYALLVDGVHRLIMKSGK